MKHIFYYKRNPCINFFLSMCEIIEADVFHEINIGGEVIGRYFSSSIFFVFSRSQKRNSVKAISIDRTKKNFQYESNLTVRFIYHKSPLLLSLRAQ